MNAYTLGAVAAANIAILILNLFVLTAVLVYRKWRCNDAIQKPFHRRRGVMLVLSRLWDSSRLSRVDLRARRAGGHRLDRGRLPVLWVVDNRFLQL